MGGPEAVCPGVGKRKRREGEICRKLRLLPTLPNLMQPLGIIIYILCYKISHVSFVLQSVCVGGRVASSEIFLGILSQWGLGVETTIS